MKMIKREDHLVLMREILLGAPVAALLWLLLVRWLAGGWAWMVPAWILGLSGLLALSLLAGGKPANAAFRFWRGLVRLIDLMVRTIICLLLYALLFTPVGLFRQWTGKRQVLRKNFRQQTSYWFPVDDSTRNRKRWLRQF